MPRTHNPRSILMTSYTTLTGGGKTRLLRNTGDDATVVTSFTDHNLAKRAAAALTAVVGDIPNVYAGYALAQLGCDWMTDWSDDRHDETANGTPWVDLEIPTTPLQLGRRVL